MTPELNVRDKAAATELGEGTRPGPVFQPAVDIHESEQGMTLVADMPGVTKENLTIDLKDYTLTIRGLVSRRPEGGAKIIHREYEVGDYFRQFSLSDLIDQAGITAGLKDGVLTLFLPKAQPVQPRRIEVQVG